MIKVFSKNMMVLPSQCDSTAKLGIPDCFAVFMDIAAEHAESLGIGAAGLMARDLFWLTVKTKVKFLRRPNLAETVTVSTWPEKPGRLRCNRDYKIMQGSETLAVGKTEWAVVNIKSGELHTVADIYPEGLEISEELAYPEPYAKIRDNFDGEPFGSYTVRSTDIDLGGHMNNVAYVRALAGAFSCAQWKEQSFSELEIQYKAPCFEGEKLQLQKRQAAKEGETGQMMELRAFRPDGKTAILAALR